MQMGPISDPFQLNNIEAFIPTSQDLTSDFMQIAKESSSFQKTKPEINEYSHPDYGFFTKSSKVEKKIQLTSERLQEFNKLQRKGGLFDNDEEKLSDLLILIKDNINEIQNGFNDVVKDQQNTDSNSSFKVRKAIVEIIQGRFIEQTSQFKKSVQERTEVMNNKEKKKNQISRPYQKDQVSHRNKPMFMQKSRNEQQEIDIEGGGEQQTLINREQRHYQQRQEGITNITNMLRDIGQSFQKLGSIVKLHEIMIERIDKNTDDSLHNLTRARKTLTETHRKVASRRGLMIKIFMILMVFATIYIVFLL